MADKNTLRILVVEDEPDLRNLYIELLVSEGYQVDQAVDGQEAFDAMRKGGYDLVLLDLMLPKVDGISILQKLHSEAPQRLLTKKSSLLLTSARNQLFPMLLVWELPDT